MLLDMSRSDGSERAKPQEKKGLSQVGTVFPARARAVSLDRFLSVAGERTQATSGDFRGSAANKERKVQIS